MPRVRFISLHWRHDQAVLDRQLPNSNRFVQQHFIISSYTSHCNLNLIPFDNYNAALIITVTGCPRTAYNFISHAF